MPPPTRPRPRRVADLPLVGYLIAPWSLLSDIRTAILRHGARISRLEHWMTTADANWAEAARIVGLVRAEVTSLREQLAAEEVDDQAQVDTAVAEARRVDAERLDELVGVLAQTLPADVPDVPTPAPGEPAVDPDSGQSSDEVIANPPAAGETTG
jgi:hypothetical protein